MSADFEWDPHKDASNQEKHGLAFRDAIAIFDDPFLLVEDATRPEFGEQRSLAIGTMADLLIAVIYTERGGKKRIISARRTRRDERQRYGAGETPA